MQLPLIFDAQRQLMEKYASIEVGVTCHEVPVPLDTREGQSRIRQFAWFYVEELGEAILAQGTDSFHEELIDALHFLTELAILSGVGPSEIEVPPPEPQLLTLRHDWSSVLYVVLKDITHPINMLKAKPWKQSWNPPDLEAYRQGIRKAYTSFLHLLKASGIHLDEVYDLYVGKNKINHLRIQGGY